MHPRYSIEMEPLNLRLLACFLLFHDRNFLIQCININAATHTCVFEQLRSSPSYSQFWCGPSLVYPKRFRKLMCAPPVLYQNNTNSASLPSFDPIMGIFVPIFCLSLGTIVIGTCGYGVPDGVVSGEFVYRLYW